MQHEGLERLISSIERKSGRKIDALELREGVWWAAVKNPHFPDRWEITTVSDLLKTSYYHYSD